MADMITYNHMAKMREASLESFPDGKFSFEYKGLDGKLIDLISAGFASSVDISSEKPVDVTWENRLAYADAIKKLRMEELGNPFRFKAVRRGMAKIIPCDALQILGWRDLKERLCGTPHVDLDFLKANTRYTIGLTESDKHISYFWQTLEAFSQDELRKFIRFACNQERIPVSEAPPLPMFLAPPDTSALDDNIDHRFIRAETCMFMVKIPQYSSLDIMKKMLLIAINQREDPLSG